MTFFLPSSHLWRAQKGRTTLRNRAMRAVTRVLVGQKGGGAIREWSLIQNFSLCIPSTRVAPQFQAVKAQISHSYSMQVAQPCTIPWTQELPAKGSFKLKAITSTTPRCFWISINFNSSNICKLRGVIVSMEQRLGISYMKWANSKRCPLHLLLQLNMLIIIR